MDYVKARTDYRVALRKWINTAERICRALDTDLAGIEEMRLHNKLPKEHEALAKQLLEEGRILDEADRKWEEVQEEMRLKTERAQEQVSKDLELIEC
jgi:hypothetical protein